MATKRSRTGCLTCRSRKLKCSEEKPVCVQCQKANRECVPSNGLTFRHHQNPSLNGQKQDDQGELRRFYGYKETFGKATTWVDVPKELTFVHTSNPYEDEPELEQYGAGYGSASQIRDASARYSISGRDSVDYGPAYPSYPAYAATQGLEALSAAASRDVYSYAPPAPPMHEQQHADPQPQQAREAQDTNLALNKGASSEQRMPPANLDPQLHPRTPTRTAARLAQHNHDQERSPDTQALAAALRAELQTPN